MLNKKLLYNKFLDSNIEIISSRYLKEYIEFCLSNNIGYKIKFKTEKHHILPKAKDSFPEYSNFNEYPWNLVHLNHEDHYKAHELYIKAINTTSSRYALLKMSEKNIRIKSDINIYKEFSKLKEVSLKECSLNLKKQFRLMKEEGTYNNFIKSRELKRQETLNKVAKGGLTKRCIALKKRSLTVTKNFYINGKNTTIAKEGAAKGVITRKKTFKKNGIETNMLIEAGIKCSNTLQEEVIHPITKKKITRQELRLENLIISNNKKAIKYKLMKDNKEICITSKSNLSKISQMLYLKSRDNYLFKDYRSKQKAIKQNKTKFIGLYVIELKSKDYEVVPYKDFINLL